MLQGIILLTLYLCDVVFSQPRDIECTEDYSLGKQIGSGGQARVREAQHIPTGRKVAVKIFFSTRDWGKEFQMLTQLETHRSAEGPKSHCFPIFYDDCLVRGRRAIVMERLDKDLLEVIRLNPTFSDRVAYADQILQCVRVLHEAGIIHQDLKLENIMVTYDNRINIVDFGLAAFIAHLGAIDSMEVMGTAVCAAPETVVHNDKWEKVRGPAGDIWATGLILHELFTGVPVAEFAASFVIPCIETLDTYQPIFDFFISYFINKCIFHRDAQLGRTEKKYLNRYKEALTSCCLFSLPQHISSESFRLCDANHWLVREYETNLQWMHDKWVATGVATETLGFVRQLLEGLLMFNHAERSTVESALANPLFKEQQSCGVE